MNIYLVKRKDPWDYDEYDSFVYVGNSLDEARKAMPCDYYERRDDGIYFKYADGTSKLEKFRTSWVSDLNLIEAFEIGTANPDVEQGVALASYNAG